MSIPLGRKPQMPEPLRMTKAIIYTLTMNTSNIETRVPLISQIGPATVSIVHNRTSHAKRTRVSLQEAMRYSYCRQLTTVTQP